MSVMKCEVRLACGRQATSCRDPERLLQQGSHRLRRGHVALGEGPPHWVPQHQQRGATGLLLDADIEAVVMPERRGQVLEDVSAQEQVVHPLAQHPSDRRPHQLGEGHHVELAGRAEQLVEVGDEEVLQVGRRAVMEEARRGAAAVQPEDRTRLRADQVAGDRADRRGDRLQPRPAPAQEP
jgi:hypothetical protein